MKVVNKSFKMESTGVLGETPTKEFAVTTVVAYLDPGTGSMIVQLALGGAAAVAVGAKFYWRRLLTLLHLRRPEDSQAQRR